MCSSALHVTIEYTVLRHGSSHDGQRRIPKYLEGDGVKYFGTDFSRDYISETAFLGVLQAICEQYFCPRLGPSLEVGPMAQI
jgi:hypothetical protein